MHKIYQKSFQKGKNLSNRFLRGFTLIELLIVVLVIGILSAIALPIYQKAVFKSCAMGGYILFQKLREAQEIFKIENGTYSEDVAALSLSFPPGNSSDYNILNCGEGFCLFRLTERPCKMSWELRWNDGVTQATSLCLAYKNSVQEYAKQFCEEKGYVYSHTSTAGTQYYILPE